MLVGGTGIAGAISALMLPVLTRLYTPQDFSLLAVLTGMIAIVSVAACLRFDIAIPVPEQDGEAANVLGLAVLSLVAVVMLLAAAMLIVPASLLARFNQPGLESYLWLVPAGVAVVALNSALQFWLIRRNDFAAIARNRVAQAGAGAATQATVGWLNGMTLGLIVGPTIAATVGCAGLAWRIVSIENHVLKDISWPRMRAAWSNYYRFPKYSALEALSNNAGIQLPIILIAALAAGPEAGFLMLAISVIQAPMGLLGTAVGQVFLSRAPQEFRLGHLGKFTAAILGGLLKTGIGPLYFRRPAGARSFCQGVRRRMAPRRRADGLDDAMVCDAVSRKPGIVGAARRQQTAGSACPAVVRSDLARWRGVWRFADRLGLISEAYAVSGFVFYLVYLVVVFHAADVHASDILTEIRAAVPAVSLWIGAGLVLKLAISFGPVARWISVKTEQPD